MKLNWQTIVRQRGGGTVVTGDFNAHCQCWDPTCIEWREASYWEETIHKHGLVIGNDDKPTQYWTRNKCEGESIIDLTLVNRRFSKWMMLEGSHSMGCDHEIIEWEVDM